MYKMYKLYVFKGKDSRLKNFNKKGFKWQIS